MAQTATDDLRYILDCDSDATMIIRYSRANWGMFWMVLEYLCDGESLENAGHSFMRQFLTFVYLSEVDSQ